MQARDAIAWLKKQKVPMGPAVQAIDLGCGHGVFGSELAREGCAVTYSDEQNFLVESLRTEPFRAFNIDRQNLAELGKFDLVICSNVLEHLSRPKPFLASLHESLKPGGFFYLSWTNWLSPWGGHEFSPFHYFGPRIGHKIFDRITGKKRKHTPFQNLFPTSIGETLRLLRENPRIEIQAVAPRYYPELAPVTQIPVLREFVTWNCALLLRRRSSSGT